MSEQFPFEGFKSVVEGIHTERERRVADARKILSFGVSYLDSALGGIFPRDLILIGAKTGIGKTQLATCIAMASARAGKRVHYFALEAEEGEIQRRIKYSLLSGIAMREDRRLHRRLNYLDWYTARKDVDAVRLDGLVNQEFDSKFRSLNVFYRGGDFYGEQLERMLLAIQDETDLICIDHLHYVDTDDANENRGYKRIVKIVRNAALSMGKPIILIAHIRKGDAKSQQLVPDIEDFHGTSDIPKIATKAIMLAPLRKLSNPGRFPTLIAPVKCRVDGSRCRYVGLVEYDARTGTYDDEYELGQIEGNEFKPVPYDKLPHWARPQGEEQLI